MIIRYHFVALDYETCSNGCGRELFELYEEMGELYQGILYWPCCDEHEQAGRGHGAWIEVYTCSQECLDEVTRKGEYFS